MDSVQRCPTGTVRKALRAKDSSGEIKRLDQSARTGGVDADILSKENKVVGIQPAMDGLNEGACVSRAKVLILIIR